MPIISPRLGAVISIVVLSLGLTTSAEAQSGLLFNEHGNYAPFRSKPAKELMTPAEFAEYEASLHALKCGVAGLILNKAFVKNYPQFADTLKNDDVANDKNVHRWEIYAYPYFKELGFCHSVVTIQEIEEELAARGVSRPKYVFHQLERAFEGPDSKINSRDLAIANLLGYAQDGYTPALVNVAELVRRGDLFDVGVEAEFYLLTRACHLGHDCASIDARLNELTASVPETRRSEIAQKARAPEALVKQVFNLGKKL